VAPAPGAGTAFVAVLRVEHVGLLAPYGRRSLEHRRLQIGEACLLRLMARKSNRVFYNSSLMRAAARPYVIAN